MISKPKQSQSRDLKAKSAQSRTSKAEAAEARLALLLMYYGEDHELCLG
jgi:hypothetical protein